MTPGHDAVLGRLRDYAMMTGDAMETWLTAREPSSYLYELVRDYPSRGGKGLRPALLLATCEAFGRPSSAGLSSAVTLEMLHNAFLVHDDVEDSSRLRRGLPTLHRLHGVALAVNAGDSLASLALRPMLEDRSISGRLGKRLLTEVATAVQKTTEGQATELGWRRHKVVELGAADYLEMVAQKTCWYTTVTPLRVGALIGSHGAAPLESVSRFGFYLGAAFQIRDDLLDLGASAHSGKDAHRDLREKKRTLMLTHALRVARGRDRSWLVAYLDDPRTSGGPAEVEHLLGLLDRCGSVEFATEYARGIQAAAGAAFDEAFGSLAPSAHVDFIRALVPFVVERSS
jgi:geranylgeranyl diphosphate synthase, type II